STPHTTLHNLITNKQITTIQKNKQKIKFTTTSISNLKKYITKLKIHQHNTTTKNLQNFIYKNTHHSHPSKTKQHNITTQVY
ncbi:gpW family head-tail joining protein, partial [Klebsiella pneumoniae]|uniref:gpW family head-tail joining protein n=1 Tax=Klebsiella pneumoniae TaxID=573 RepID=UPI003B5A1A61